MHLFKMAIAVFGCALSQQGHCINPCNGRWRRGKFMRQVDTSAARQVRAFIFQLFSWQQNGAAEKAK